MYLSFRLSVLLGFVIFDHKACFLIEVWERVTFEKVQNIQKQKVVYLDYIRTKLDGPQHCTTIE